MVSPTQPRLASTVLDHCPSMSQHRRVRSHAARAVSQPSIPHQPQHTPLTPAHLHAPLPLQQDLPPAHHAP